MADDRVEGYATALFEVARAEGVLPRVEEELFNLSHLLTSNDELRTTLSDAAIPGDRRQAIIEDLIGKRAEAITTLLVEFEVARAEGVLPRVEEELFNLSHLLTSNDELRTTLSDSAIPGDRRQAIIEDLIGKRAEAITTLLVEFVVAAGRARDLPAIISNLVERAAADRQHAVAEVRSAVPLDDDQRRRLAQALSKNLGKEVEVKVYVDPSVLGGLSARVGDVVIDGTVRHRLDQLKETIR